MSEPVKEKLLPLKLVEHQGVIRIQCTKKHSDHRNKCLVWRLSMYDKHVATQIILTGRYLQTAIKHVLEDN